MSKDKGRQSHQNISITDQGRGMRQQRTSTPSHRGGRGGGNRK